MVASAALRGIHAGGRRHVRIHELPDLVALLRPVWPRDHPVHEIGYGERVRLTIAVALDQFYLTPDSSGDPGVVSRPRHAVDSYEHQLLTPATVAQPRGDEEGVV